MSTCRHCGQPFSPWHHPQASASGNFYCDERCRTAHLVGVYSPSLERRHRTDRRMADRRVGDRRAS